MQCRHCCYSCNRNGTDMSLKTFRAAIEHSTGFIALGGGEPTIHPQFWEILGYSLGHCDEGLWLATNGKKTNTAIALARMARRGVISCALSLDDWHEDIDPRVREAFKGGKSNRNWSSMNDNPNDYREIRTVTFDNLSYAGRAKEMLDEPEEDEDQSCPCQDVIIKPNGDAYLCGCEGAPKIGDVFEGWETWQNEHGDWPCCKDEEVECLT